jgi:hypothetical protein
MEKPWSNGAVEYWSNGKYKIGIKSFFPSLHHSNTPVLLWQIFTKV